MAEASASGGGGRTAGSGIAEGFTNLAAEDSEDELRSSEWEARLASGDLPEDFLRVTEPKAENRDDFAFPWIKAVGPFDEPCISPNVQKSEQGRKKNTNKEKFITPTRGPSPRPSIRCHRVRFITDKIHVTSSHFTFVFTVVMGSRVVRLSSKVGLSIHCPSRTS